MKRDPYEIITIPVGCEQMFTPHPPHHWREGFLWWDKIECPGVRNGEKDVWREANPSLGVRADMDKLQAEYAAGKKTANQVRAKMGFPTMGPAGDLYIKQSDVLTVNQGIEEAIAKAEEHKHFFRLTGWAYNHKEGLYSQEARLGFTCRGCPTGEQFEIVRWEWNEMTRDFSKVDQTWPS